MLLGATLYGFSNVTEEFLVSKRPLYEVVGQIGFWGIFINGVQAAIFDRKQFDSATWNGKVGGYIVGFTICLFTFYSLAPVLFRMASAAFFNISLLTANFWGLLIGIKVFGYTIMYLYGIAFTCIVLGLLVYHVLSDVLGESKKPWLGGKFSILDIATFFSSQTCMLISPSTDNQEEGVAGVGTAKRKIDKNKARSDNSQEPIENSPRMV